MVLPAEGGLESGILFPITQCVWLPRGERERGAVGGVWGAAGNTMHSGGGPRPMLTASFPLRPPRGAREASGG